MSDAEICHVVADYANRDEIEKLEAPNPPNLSALRPTNEELNHIFSSADIEFVSPSYWSVDLDGDEPLP
ncbi:MAG: hypothetical protein V4443_09885 [Pseudomonadota bacterium]